MFATPLPTQEHTVPGPPQPAFGVGDKSYRTSRPPCVNRPPMGSFNTPSLQDSCAGSVRAKDGFRRAAHRRWPPLRTLWLPDSWRASACRTPWQARRPADPIPLGLWAVEVRRVRDDWIQCTVAAMQRPTPSLGLSVPHQNVMLYWTSLCQETEPLMDPTW
jgi:hypothetical protein